METRLNIAEILKDKPVNTRLYSPIFGNCILVFPEGMIIKDKSGKIRYFYDDGRFSMTGESLLFPSKEMRDWSKFAWKKGDVLVNSDKSLYIIFEKFDDDTYISFKGKHYLWKGGDEEDYSKEEANMATSLFEKANDESAQAYINAIEKRLGGKLYLETLEIEKTQPEFKDGDVVCISGMGYLAYGIVKSIDNSSKKLEYYVLNDMSTLKIDDWLSFEDKQIQPITETQRIILFDALAKENKAWDAEKKQIVDLKPKVEFKPFDKVLVRDCLDEMWRPSFFAFYLPFGREPYQVIGGEWVKLCIPYEGNESLLGTTKNVED